MDKKLKLIFLSLVLILLFTPMVSAKHPLFKRCISDPDCEGWYGSGWKCVKALGDCVSKEEMQKTGWMQSRAVSPLKGGVQNFLAWVFGWHALSLDFRWILSYIIIFVMLLFAFSDIFKLFLVTSSEYTCWILGGGLAALVALSGVLSKLVAWIFGFIALYGAIAVAMGLVFAFTCYIVLHLILFKNIRYYIKKRVAGKAVGKTAIETLAGQEFLQKIGGSVIQRTKLGKFPWLSILVGLGLLMLILFFVALWAFSG